MDITGITVRQFEQADGVEDWRVVGEGACAVFRTGSFAAAARLITDEHAPAWWVLADPEGNETCVATTKSRD